VGSGGGRNATGERGGKEIKEKKERTKI